MTHLGIFFARFKLNLIKYMIIGYIYKPAKPTQRDFTNIVNTTG